MNEINFTRKRIQSIDILRGIIMVIMAIDHVRDFYHAGAVTYDPTNLNTAGPALFFTRWITHFCAPVFVFLSGVSAYLAGQRRSRKELSRFLIKRGLWLIAAELIFVTFALTLNPLYNILILQVIWAIGTSMVVLGLLVRFPINVIAFIGALIFVFHNLFDYMQMPKPGALLSVIQMFMTALGAFIPIGANHALLVLYAVIPWTGVMLLGYAFGTVYHADFPQRRRYRILIFSGLTLIILFVILRFINRYGNPEPWTVQKNNLYTFMSFVNTRKYPPSLLYASMTLGPALLALAFFEGKTNWLKRIFLVYGKVPFFYYILHFYLIRLLNVLFFYMSGYQNGQISEPNNLFLFRPASFGYSLPLVYLIWFLIVAALYFPCRWFAGYKNRNSHWWLNYI